MKEIAGSEFETWIHLFPSITNPADRLRTADPDRDGKDNLMEFAVRLAGNAGSVTLDHFGSAAVEFKGGHEFSPTFRAAAGALIQSL